MDDVPNHPDPYTMTLRKETHVEVLWRTLIADCWGRQHPTSLEAGYAFVDRLVQDMRMAFFASKMGHVTSPRPSSQETNFNCVCTSLYLLSSSLI